VIGITSSRSTFVYDAAKSKLEILSMSKPSRTNPAALAAAVSIAFAIGSIAFATIPTAPKSSEQNRIYVTDFAGGVEVSVDERSYVIEIDSTIELPSRIVTASDGSLDLKQAQTSISVAQDTEITIPETAVDGQLIARLVQHRGNVFYDVQQREVESFRVETPYLVAVIKGTQFNVSVQSNATTISLFEGRLELVSPDGSETVNLVAGEIAIRSLDEPRIRVLGMDDTGPDVGSLGLIDRSRGNVADGLRLPTVEDVVEGVVARIDENPSVALGGDDASQLGAGAPASALDASLGIEIQLDQSAVSAGLDTGLDIGAGSVNAALDVGLDLGGSSIAVDTGLDAGVDLGSGSVDVGLDAGLDLGGGGIAVDTGLDAGIDLGGVSAELGADLDLGSGSGLDVGVDAGVDLGDAGVDLGVDLGDGLNVDVDADLGPAVEPVEDLVDDVVDVLRGGLGGLLGGGP
jgi:hypothetical protein